jgi:hypothetical protein
LPDARGGRRRPFRPAALLRGIAICVWLPLRAAGAEAFFYHGLDYGSEAMIQPASIVLIGGYSIFQTGDRDRDPFGVDYRNGWRNVWRNVADPIGGIRAFGWRKFLASEVFPTSLAPKSAQYVPNYEMHLIGSGMTFRQLSEWYGAHGFGHGRIWSAATCYTYHVLNEVVENDAYRGVNVDPIADLWIFDPAGIILFSSDRVCRFFGETLHMRDWSTPAAFDPVRRTIENNADDYMIRWKLPGSPAWSLFYHFGLNGLLGLSRTLADGSTWSAGAGAMTKELKSVRSDGGGRVMTADLIWNAGVYYDRNGSLMASLLFSGSRVYRTKLILFPGVVRVKGVSPWLFAALGRKNEIVVGGGVRWMPMGVSFIPAGSADRDG